MSTIQGPMGIYSELPPYCSYKTAWRVLAVGPFAQPTRDRRSAFRNTRVREPDQHDGVATAATMDSNTRDVRAKKRRPDAPLANRRGTDVLTPSQRPFASVASVRNVRGGMTALAWCSMRWNVVGRRLSPRVAGNDVKQDGTLANHLNRTGNYVSQKTRPATK